MYIARLEAAGFGETLAPFLEAEILVHRKSWAAAIARIERHRPAWRESPRLAGRADLMLAECHGHLGEDERRLNALRRAGDGDRSPELARVALAGAMSAAGQVDGALRIIAPAAAHDPRRRLEVIRLLIERTGRLPADRRDWNEVEAQLREAERSLPDAAGPLTLLEAAILAARGRPDQARSLLAAAQTKYPRDPTYRLALARLAQRQGQGPSALRIIDEAEKDLGPSLAVQLARLEYWGLEGGDAAVAAVAGIANAAPSIPAADRPSFLDRLAEVETGLGRTEQAREHLGQLAALVPEDLRLLSRRLDLAVQAGDHADAPGAGRQAPRRRGGSRHALAVRACLDAPRPGPPGAASDLDAARTLAARIAELRPEWWGGPVLQAELAELAGRADEAIQDYTRAIELGNNDPGVARRLAGLLDQKGDLGPLERVARVLTDRGASAADLTVAAALDAIRRREYDRGIALARRTFPENSTHHADHLMLGRFYLAAHRTDAAGRELRRAVELGPGVPATWVSYIQYLVLTRQLDVARAAVDSAAKALPPDRADLAVAQCAAIVGDAARAEARIGAALGSPGCDAATIRTAVDVLVGQGRFDRVEPLLDRLERPRCGPRPRRWPGPTAPAAWRG